MIYSIISEKYYSYWNDKLKLIPMTIVDNYHNRGFSLVELVTVIVLLGILSVVALGRFTDQDSFAARGFFDDTVAALNFAQKLAISTGCDVAVDLASNSYEVRRSSACTADDFLFFVSNPANRNDDYESDNMPAGFVFDNVGRVIFNARGAVESGAGTYNLKQGAITVDTFIVYATTGLVD
jgi:MSHA pilin protein MshC